MYSYDTVVEALADLNKRGFTHNFNIEFDQIKCLDTGICLLPSAFSITETYRFEGDTNPADEDVVYALTSHDGNYKGVITSAYGMYADAVNTAMIKKLSFIDPA